jgi:hypothetical protein
VSDDQDYRLELELEAIEASHGALERLVSAGRSERRVAADAQLAVGEGVAITHDGNRLFAYANTEPSITAARRAIESVLRRDALAARITMSHWDRELDEWRQIDPPPSSAVTHEQDAAAETLETQTIVASAGKLVRASVEQVMGDWARKLGLTCEIVEHPHLLTTQVAFTVRGPRHKVEEFRDALKEEGWATIRADGFGTGLV